MVDTEGEFIPPPEAPVFEPSWEEFQDALGYIAKIRPIAEKTGICKIKPPPDWQPPFAVDVDTFRFTPRVQRLNELEAKTRIKLNFLDRLAKFWELQGTPLRIPLVERKYLDLYLLQKIVSEEGGFEIVCKERKWSKVSNRLNYPGGKGVGSTLRQHYERVLYPFDVFRSGIYEADVSVPSMISESLYDVKLQKEQSNGSSAIKTEIKQEDVTVATVKMEGDQDKTEIVARRSKRIAKDDSKNLDMSMNSELKKLQFYGAGPKMAIPETVVKEIPEEESTTATTKKGRMKTRDKKLVSYVDMYMCHICNRGDGEEYMLLCDGCDDAFHTYCLIPPLNDIPGGDWRCPKCVAKVCAQSKMAYGFEQAKREYTLQSYGEMADQFKLDYFNMPVHLVPCSTVEREFWRLVNCIEEDVVVEYGADIHAMEFGSGFPTSDNKDLLPEDEEYMTSGWNLNNLPVLEESVLKYIGGDISGMKVPWCYVGMCFSSFAWHTEDHWSYSINYMHWGEPKTWYGVPGAKAELLEECMKKNAPELFEQSPDLLHQLTTIMNPNVLMAYGVPIVRTNQCAGEFVITFPRSYHTGFNQGYNFAEAVNFCPADWVRVGRSCINQYQVLKRQCVFSHDELICKIATYPERIDLTLAASIHQDMLLMVDAEKENRKKLLKMGVAEAEREAFELLPDDERQCCVCNTTCFLSAVTCSCTSSKLVCILHAGDLCECPPDKLCLRYRYTLDELPAMLQRLKVRAETFDTWAFKVKTVLEAEGKDKVDLNELRELVNEARDKKFPESPLMQALADAMSEAEKCSNVAAQLLSHKVRTRNRQSGDSKYVAKLSLEELQCFSEQIHALPCIIKETELIQALVEQVETFQVDAQEALSETVPSSVALQKLMETAVTLDVDLPEIPKLKQLLQQAQWLDEVKLTLQDPNEVTLEAMRKLLEAGVALAPHEACERAMAELQELLTVSERWEEKARICLQVKPRHSLATLEGILSETANIPAMLPNISLLLDAVRKAKDWITRIVAIQTGEHYPYVETLEGLVNKGRPIPVRLDQLAQLETQVASAKSWRERTARTFLKKNSTYNLVEILSPRTNIGMLSGKLKRKKLIKEGSGERETRDVHVIGDIKMDDNRDPASIVAAFKVAEAQEVTSMRDLRLKNTDHYNQERLTGKYCLCRRCPAGLMLQCELCKDWFHSTCVPLPKSANLKAKTSSAALIQAAKDLKFLCPLCLRSRRPRLETILSLLVSLQKLPVRMPEGEALQCLTERAMAWQDKARQALATDELSSALARLSVMSQRMVEQAAREKTEKIISAELMKAASNPELHDHLQSVTPAAFGPQDTEDVSGMEDVDDNVLPGPLEIVPSSPITSDDSPSDVEVQQLSVGMSSEHAYSTASKSGIAASPKKQQRKSPLLARQCDPTVLKLSMDAQRQLEELMMEGDLLEVSLDETQHIWRILQSCASNATSRILHIQSSEAEVLKLKAEKKKKRRKELAEAGLQPTEGEVKIKKKKKKILLPDGTEKFVKDLGDQKPKDPEKKKRKKKVKKDLTAIMLDNDDGDDECSALKCIKPAGEEVNWVQCDGCEEWFHLLCVGLAEDEISENEDYICFQCRKAKLGDGVQPMGDMLSTANLSLGIVVPSKSMSKRPPLSAPGAPKMPPRPRSADKSTCNPPNSTKSTPQMSGLRAQLQGPTGQFSEPRPQLPAVTVPMPEARSRLVVPQTLRALAVECSMDDVPSGDDTLPEADEGIIEVDDSDDDDDTGPLELSSRADEGGGGDMSQHLFIHNESADQSKSLVEPTQTSITKATTVSPMAVCEDKPRQNEQQKLATPQPQASLIPKTLQFVADIQDLGPESVSVEQPEEPSLMEVEKAVTPQPQTSMIPKTVELVTDEQNESHQESTTSELHNTYIDIS